MAIEQLQEEYVKCRSWGHEWDTFQPIKRAAKWGTLLSLRCVRCGTERHDTIDINGDLSTRKYEYPNGYALTADERPATNQLRLEILRRLRRAS